MTKSVRCIAQILTIEHPYSRIKDASGRSRSGEPIDFKHLNLGANALIGNHSSRFGNLGSYAAVAIFGTGSRLVSLGSQFVALFVLTRLLSKSEFGEFMTVFAAFRIIAYGIGTGCMSGLLYHVARDPTDRTEIRAHRSFALMALFTVIIFEVVLILMRHQVGELFEKPGLERWIVLLSPFGLFSTLIFTAAGALDGRQRINASITLSEFAPNVLRLVLLIAILLLRLPIWTIGLAFTMSVAIPYIIVLLRLLAPTVGGLWRITSWDLHYSATFTGHSLLSMQLQGIDMLIVSYLFSSEQAADYAIAGRIAVMYPFLQQIVFKKFMPRCGLMISRHEHEALFREAKACRTFSVIAVCGLTAAILAMAPWIVRGAGDYTSALGLLVALSGPAFARAFFAGGDAILRMSGAANFSVMIMFFSFLFVVLTPLIAYQWLGIYTLPLGMTLSAVLLNPLIARKIHQVMGFWLISRRDIAILIAGLVGIAASTFLAGPQIWRWPVIALLVALPGVLIAATDIRQLFRKIQVLRTGGQADE